MPDAAKEIVLSGCDFGVAAWCMIGIVVIEPAGISIVDADCTGSCGAAATTGAAAVDAVAAAVAAADAAAAAACALNSLDTSILVGSTAGAGTDADGAFVVTIGRNGGISLLIDGMTGAGAIVC